MEDLLNRMSWPQNRPKPDDTVIVISVSKRIERNFTKELIEFDIGWSNVEGQLELYGCYFHIRERLTVKITFRVRLRNTALQIQAGAKGRQSATRRMRCEQAL